MKKIVKNIFSILLIALIASPGISYAQSQLVELSSQLSFKPINASVILMNTGGSKTLSNTKLKNVAGNIYSALVEIPEAYKEKEVFASALFIGENGTFAMSDVIKVTRDSGQSYLSLPVCDLAQDIAIDASTAGQIGLLESLEEIRLARRSLLRKKLAELLTPEFQERLVKIESGFGLNSANALSSDLAPFEILNRLERVKNSLAAYQQTKTTK